MIIYLDEDYKCHITQDLETWGMVETEYFDGKCNEFIEGYRYVPAGCEWTRADGVTFSGLMVTPWKNWSDLDDAQRKYEKEQYSNMTAANESLVAENAELLEAMAAMVDDVYNQDISEFEEEE